MGVADEKAEKVEAPAPAPAAADVAAAADKVKAPAPAPTAADEPVDAPAPVPATPAKGTLGPPRPGRLEGDAVSTSSEANLGACQRMAAAAPDAAGYRFCQAAAGCGDDAPKGTCDLIETEGEGGVRMGAGWISGVRRVKEAAS